MFAKFPRSPSNSRTSTPAPAPRRRIRCKACRWVVDPIYTTTCYDSFSVSWRQELAAREHMLDHGQLGPPTPSSVGTFTLVDSPRPFMNDVKPRKLSVPDQLGSDLSKAVMIRRGSSRRSFSETKPRLLGLDGLASLGRGMSESFSLSAPEVEDLEIEREKKPDTPGINALVHPHSLSAQLHNNPQLAALRTISLSKSITTPSPTLASALPTLLDQRCSGYFVEAVCPYNSTFRFFQPCGIR